MTYSNTSPSDKLLRSTRKEFERMLSQKTTEPEWQQFFTEHPYVLSLALPLKLDPQDIIPLARPGVTEPDFIFYPRKYLQPHFYGIIELKRPDSKIVTMTRSNVAILTRDADTAIEQTKAYSDSIMKSNNIVFLGNESYMFVIMGMSSELTSKLPSRFYQDMINNKLPGNLQILPYDLLYNRFDQEVPPKLHVLVPSHDDQDIEPTDSNEKNKKNLEELEISVRTYNALKHLNINTIDELISKSAQELLSSEYFGQKSFNEIEEIVSKMGLELNTDVKQNDKKSNNRV